MTPYSGSGVSRTVLVVDDEPAVRSVICRLLEEWDFRVLEAGNGEEALRLAKEVRGNLALVVTDVLMPVMDGYEFARTFRPLHPNVPILFITGHRPKALDAMTKKGEQLLFKPFGPDAFLETVGRLLESRVNASRTSA
ncbi:MAG TPA: response regulator [Gemmatimonadales bacterium]|nr:response regulator [Gemmatimonadales bacterium]